MYIRNVKQLLRAHRGDGQPSNGNGAEGAPVSGGFDERQYGFGGLMDLLRACQRDGLVRVERDRRGGLRVFPGQALQRTDTPRTDSVPPAALQVEQVEIGNAIESDVEPGDELEPGDAQPNLIDTTAELLGRAKPRKPRARAAAAPAAARGMRKPAARKPAAARRPARAKKSASGSDESGNS
jgi:hypothetical protein